MRIDYLVHHLIHLCKLESMKDDGEKAIASLDISEELLLIGFVKVLGHDNFLDLLAEYEDDIESTQLLEWYGDYLVQKPDVISDIEYTFSDYLQEYENYSVN